MENHEYIWNQTNLNDIKWKIKNRADIIKRKLLITRDLPSKLVDSEEFCEILMDPLMNLDLGKQECVTLFRSIRRDRDLTNETKIPLAYLMPSL